jgi:hypothetical protein
MTKPALPDDLLWGVQAIADHIKRTVRQTYYLIENELIPVKKLGARTIVARASELDRVFSRDDGVLTVVKSADAQHQATKRTKGA